jgi:hypothetical protein
MKRVLIKAGGLLAALCLLASFAACNKASGKIDKDGKITLQFWSIYPKGDNIHPWVM